MDRKSWALIGAGSLGSKIAMHLGRAGCAPSVVIDREIINPHNAARHALYPRVRNMQMLWMDTKARLLCDALNGLGQQSEAITEDITAVISSDDGISRLRKPWVIVNTTASLVVREALAAAPAETLQARVVEGALYAQGRVGLLGIEGPERNPNLGDLIAEFYAVCRENEALQSIIFGETEGELTRIGIGEGCGSLTMPMSDGQLSLHAAGMSEYLLERMRQGLPDDGGKLIIGLLSETKLGVNWNTFAFGPVEHVTPANTTDWKVRIHERAVNKITAEVARWPACETGGVLIGRLSEVSRTFNIVDVIAAPEDSTRSASEFVIGMNGLRKIINGYASSTNWALYCLGTWHSHVVMGGASATDRAAAKAMALARVTPSVLLIRSPNGFEALIADQMDIRKMGR